MAKIDNFSVEELQEIVSDSRTLQEVLKKLGYSSTSGANRKTVQSRLDKYNISTEHFTKGVSNGIASTPENTFVKDSDATQAVLRRLYLKGNYTPYKCSICGQEPFWNGKELSLTLDHIDGDNTNDVLDNLRWVCPNCDRQLDTFGSKNRRLK